MSKRNNVPYRQSAEYRAAAARAAAQQAAQRRAARVRTLENVGGNFAPLFRV